MIRFSVCIPSYNRACFLRPLLDSIVNQDFESYDIIIAEDCSPERELIKKIVIEYQEKYGAEKIKYYENRINLGFDGNLRQLIQLSDGEFCFFMGNDDLLASGALSLVNARLNKYDNVGIILRSYGWFNAKGTEQVVRYCNGDKLLLAGEQAIVFSYRRVGVISGFVVNRLIAFELETDKYDGTLYYQMYLAFNVLKSSNALYIDNTIVQCRNDIPPDFGNSKSEKGLYTPGNYTLSARVKMISNILNIAYEECEHSDYKIYSKILSDISKYSYPILSKERDRGLLAFMKYYFDIGSLGMAKSFYYHFYFILLFIFGKKISDNLIYTLKKRIGYTPAL